MHRIPATFFLLAALTTAAYADTWLVVPLSNLTAKPNMNWIGESAAESITEALTREGILVVDREDRKEGERRLALKPNTRWTRASILKLAESLDADRVVFGSFEMAASEGAGMGTLKLAAQTINVRDLRKGGTFSETGPLEDLATLQSHLAWQVLKYSAPQSAPSEEQFRLTRTSIRVDALENYVRGLLAEDPDAQERYFQQALKLDGRYSQAAYQYGRLLFLRNNNPSAALQLEKVKNWDPHYRSATFMLGIAKFRMNEFRAAEAAFLRVSKEVPLSEVLNNLGVTQFRLNQPEAVENLRRALEGDDKDPVYHFNLGVALLSRGANAEAAEQFRATLDRDPKDQEATKLLGRSLRPPTTGISREELAGLERLKLDYEDAAYQQLKVLMSPKKK
ncbi:tetratricopeptide repeat protein [Bryobacter aggregatus]|uniref:tetratricopeptide repeat protein n=1 Tax=Bryobacter aggregatus TaxID=360054 RepID=UPI0009B5BCD4|nr:tetratricopeptide repeat protein [Bryobacter aggregatus]